MARAADEHWGRSLADAALALARRFAGGGTLWCVAPRHPEHAQHVAVEFVHPVIVGTRALPAVAVPAPDTLDVLVAPGDMVVVIGTANDDAVLEALRRRHGVDVTTVWFGWDEPPSGDVADHVVWIEGDPGADPVRNGEVVLGYHVLWELTQVCFEHPGLLVDTGREANAAHA